MLIMLGALNLVLHEIGIEIPSIINGLIILIMGGTLLRSILNNERNARPTIKYSINATPLGPDESRV